LGREGWLAKYGDAFRIRRNFAHAYYCCVYDYYARFTTMPHHTLESHVLTTGAELQRRFECYFLDRNSPHPCAGSRGWTGLPHARCQCDPFTQHAGWPFKAESSIKTAPSAANKKITVPGPDPNGLKKKLLIVVIVIILLALMKYILS
jgi:hypothetical protein